MKQVQVAVGVLKQHNQVLIARRQAHQTHAHHWEFPGGKIEAGESAKQALTREFAEEVGVEVEAWQPLIQIPWQYEHLKVNLQVFVSESYFGEVQGCEGQEVRWVELNDLVDYAFPVANQGILTALTLPDAMLITGEFQSEADGMARLQGALQKGIRLVQLRAKTLDKAEFIHWANKAVGMCHQHHAKVVLNAKPEWLAEVPMADGLQLSSSALMAMAERPIAEDKLLSVSVHHPAEIAKALTLQADCLLLSPVQATSSHPEMAALGWPQFAQWTADIPVPVYALGGMQAQDIEQAKACGAQGVAAISGFWPQSL